MKKNQSGVVMVLVMVALVAVIVAVVGFVFYTGGQGKYENYTNEQVYSPEPTISESDKTTDIEMELDATDLELEEMEKELDDLDSDAESL